MDKSYKDVLDFWFDPKHIDLHFLEDPAFDEKIRGNFLSTWEKAAEGLLFDWRKTIHGRLAEIIVLDQFSRNLFRNDIRTYTQDKMAIALAQEVVFHPDYEKLSPDEKRYILLPFMHSESIPLHDWVTVIRLSSHEGMLLSNPVAVTVSVQVKGCARHLVASSEQNWTNCSIKIAQG